MAGDEELVVREELLGLLLGSRLGVVWDVRGIAGAGKSVLLRQLRQRADRDDSVVLMEMQDYFTAFEQGDAAGGVKGAGGELRRFGRLLSAVMSGLRDRPTAARGALDDILNDIGRAVHGAEELIDVEAQERAEELVERLRDEINQLIVARAEAGGHVYLLVDAFELVIDRPLGQWLLRLLDGLDGSVVAVARRADQAPAALPEAAGVRDFGELEVLEIGEMTAGQVRDYLVRRLGPAGDEIAAAVHRFTGGHALAVGLTADLAADMRLRGEPVTADGPLGELFIQLGQGRGDDPEGRLARLVSRFIQSAKEHDPAISDGLDCLWAVRRFDFPLLESLLQSVGREGGYRLAERLVSYSFVERRTPPDRPAEQYYIVHDRVRRQGHDQLLNTSRLETLLDTAQDFYQAQATETLEGYERWFRYEDPSWQTIAREWLYHVAQLKGDKRLEGRLGMAVLFVDAFWWWGNYVSFPFCEELLADWAEMADARQDKVDLAWGESLREIYLRYPKGWRRQASQDDWRALRRRLINLLQERPELRGQTDKRARHVRGLLDIYLAEAERFLDPHSRRVDERLLEARELLIADEDEWNAAWVWFQQADAALWRGDGPGAVGAADAGRRELTEMDDDDFELAANLHRVHADAAWLNGDRALALDLHARAALSAYKFQVAVGDPDIPPIDEYTQAFMAEMHERAAERLAAMHRDGQDQAVRDACARIRRFFDPYWQTTADSSGEPGGLLEDPAGLLAEGRAKELVGRLFPPVPAAADLHQPDTAYALTASEVLYDMEDELERPPGTPLPPDPS